PAARDEVAERRAEGPSEGGRAGQARVLLVDAGAGGVRSGQAAGAGDGTRRDPGPGPGRGLRSPGRRTARGEAPAAAAAATGTAGCEKPKEAAQALKRPSRPPSGGSAPASRKW